MPTATARRRAPLFDFGSPVESEPQAPWSGRIDADECGRPGGLLYAALAQCAGERDLTLNRLADALGVSYWSLSTLRIGFRPIEALDEAVVDACAAFLGLPPLTVRMLAGLLDPTDALQAPELTGADLLHARQLMAVAPEDLVLLPPPNPERPLQGLGVDELLALHQSCAACAPVCALLRTELRHRPMSKTEQLRALLDERPVPEAEPAAPDHAVLRCAHCQTRLRVPQLAAAGEIRCPACKTEYGVHWQGLVCVVQRIEPPAEDEPAPDAPAADDPWSVLGLDADSPWDAVERARRTLLQQYHPDRLGHVSPLVQKLAEDAFKRVGDAYEALRTRR